MHNLKFSKTNDFMMNMINFINILFYQSSEIKTGLRSLCYMHILGSSHPLENKTVQFKRVLQLLIIRLEIKWFDFNNFMCIKYAKYQMSII